ARFGATGGADCAGAGHAEGRFGATCGPSVRAPTTRTGGSARRAGHLRGRRPRGRAAWRNGGGRGSSAAAAQDARVVGAAEGELLAVEVLEQGLGELPTGVELVAEAAE